MRKKGRLGDQVHINAGSALEPQRMAHGTIRAEDQSLNTF